MSQGNFTTVGRILFYNSRKKIVENCTGASTGTGPVSGVPGPAVVGPPKKDGTVWSGLLVTRKKTGPVWSQLSRPVDRDRRPGPG